MVKLILDTSFLVDLLLNREEAVALAREIELKEIIKTTSISVYEIYRGLKSKDKSKKVEELFDSVIILNFDKGAAKLAGKISQELAIKGQEIDPEDCMIAAITLLNNDSLVTRNLAHFKRIPTLEIRTY